MSEVDVQLTEYEVLSLRIGQAVTLAVTVLLEARPAVTRENLREISRRGADWAMGIAVMVTAAQVENSREFSKAVVMAATEIVNAVCGTLAVN